MEKVKVESTPPITDEEHEDFQRREATHFHSTCDEQNLYGTESGFLNTFEQIDVYENQENALDLRLSNIIERRETERSIEPPRKNNKQGGAIAHLLEKLYSGELLTSNASSTFVSVPHGINFSTVYTETPYQSYTDNDDFTNPIDYSTQCINPSENSCTYGDAVCSKQGHWNVGTNTEPVEVMNQGSQTELRETRDSSVQTDMEPKILACSLRKNVEKTNIKYTCTICKRFYSTKSSYDRHFKTHLKGTFKKVITNVHFSTEASVQVFKRQMTETNIHKPIIITVPRRAAFQCKMCFGNFFSQYELDIHYKNCNLDMFPETKCPHCSIKFYTIGCLNEHIDLVHKKESENSAYYCIYCNESFDAAYSFHVHLNSHLSPT